MALTGIETPFTVAVVLAVASPTPLNDKADSICPLVAGMIVPPREPAKPFGSAVMDANSVGDSGPLKLTTCPTKPLKKPEPVVPPL